MQIDTLHRDSIPRAREQLIASLQLNTDSAPNLYALVDHAFAHSRDFFSRWPGPRPYTANLMSHIPGAADCVSPLLVAMPTEIDQRNSAIETLLSRCNGLAMLSFITSFWSIDAVAYHMGVFTEIALPPDDQVFVLRLADTRVIPALTDALTPEQRRTFLTPIMHWAYPDRSANWVVISGCVGECGPQPSPLALSPAQHDSLMLASLPDSLVPLIAEEFPDFADQTPSVQYRNIKTWVMQTSFNAGGDAEPSACLAHCRSMLSE